MTKAIVPVEDVVGSKKISTPSLVPDPRQCFDDNFILARQYRFSIFSL